MSQVAEQGELRTDAEEILRKIEGFQTEHAGQLADAAKFYKQYRAVPTKTRRETQSNTFIPEMFVEVEALATAIHEMIHTDTDGSTFFDLEGRGEDDDAWSRAKTAQGALEEQMRRNHFEEKTLPWLRMLPLMGSYPIATPWSLRYRTRWDGFQRVREPSYDSWDFAPFHLWDFAFDDTRSDIEEQGWAAQTSHVTASGGLSMVRAGIWDEAVMRDALEEGLKRSPQEREWRAVAGYQDVAQARGLTVYEYHGELEGREDGEMYWAYLASNGKFLMPPQLPLYAHGEKPWLMSHWFSLPGEPLSMGVGHINSRTQSEINDRRNFINDLMYASLYHMWLARSDSGMSFPGDKFKWSPHGILRGDLIGDDALRPLRPDLRALSAAVNVEGGDIEKMRRHSGATSTLQAISTGITATEASQIMSEATRRIKAMVRANISSTLRRFVTRAHQLNRQFLDRPFPAYALDRSGVRVYGDVTREDLIEDPNVIVKMTTDLDYRPFMRKELIEMLSVFQKLGPRANIEPLLERLARFYGMDPRKFFRREGLIEIETQRQAGLPATAGRAMGELVSGSPAAQSRLAQFRAAGIA